MLCEDRTVFNNQHRVGEPKGFDALRNLADLLLGMGPCIGRPGRERTDRDRFNILRSLKPLLCLARLELPDQPHSFELSFDRHSPNLTRLEV